jgi:hypothetical protein
MSSEAAQALLSRNSAISVVVELSFLHRQDLVAGNSLDVANVMMGTNERRMARIVKKSTNRQQLTFVGILTRALRVEAHSIGQRARRSARD